MYQLFGGYWGYLAAPLDVAIEQRCVIIARQRVKKRKNDELQAEIEERQRALGNR